MVFQIICVNNVIKFDRYLVMLSKQCLYQHSYWMKRNIHLIVTPESGLYLMYKIEAIKNIT